MNYKKTSLLLVFIGAVIAFALIADAWKDHYLRRLITSEIEQKTGLHASLDGVRYNLLRGEFEMTGFVLKNPAEFGDSSAIVIDRLLIKAGIRALLSDPVLVNVCEIDIGFLGIIDTPELDSNFEVIADLLKGKSSQLEYEYVPGGEITPKQPTTDDHETGEYLSTRGVTDRARSKDVKISQLRIFLGEVRLEVASRPRQRPIEMTVRVDDAFEYSEVEDLEDILDEMLAEIMAVAGPQLLLEALNP